MALIRREFLNSNEARAYPLHERATRRSGAGLLLPNNLLVDANIWIPSSLGNFVYLSSASSSSGLLTLTFLAMEGNPLCTAISSSVPGSIQPVASLSLTKPVQPYRNYALTPLQNGVGGWVTFGQGAVSTDTYHILLPDGAAGLLVDRVVRVYAAPPVTAIGKEDSPLFLRGDVTLKGDTSRIYIRRGERVINGETREVILIGLNIATNPVTTLSRYIGVCGTRPSVGSCAQIPLVSVEGVEADSNGNLDIIFEAPVIVGGVQDGLVLDYPLGLKDICADPWKILEQVEELCHSSYISSLSSSMFSSSLSSDQDISSSSSQSSLVPDNYSIDFTAEPPGKLPPPLLVGLGGAEVKLVGGKYHAVTASDAGLTIVRDQLHTYDLTGGGIQLSAIVTPRNDAHLLFGFTRTSRSNNYWAVGVEPAGTKSGTGNGCFYLAYKGAPIAASGGLFGPGLPGSGFRYIEQYASSVVLPAAEYLLLVNPVVVGGNLVVTWSATWGGGSASGVFVGTATGINYKSVGFGSALGETLFDSFGVDTTP